MKEAEVANPGRPGNSTAGLFLPSGNSPTAFITAGGSHGRPVSLPGGFPSGFFALPGRILSGLTSLPGDFPPACFAAGENHARLFSLPFGLPRPKRRRPSRRIYCWRCKIVPAPDDRESADETEKRYFVFFGGF
jgi:hypothetical protein